MTAIALKTTASLARLQTRPRNHCQPRKSALRVNCNTLWYLAPDPKWCSKAENQALCKKMGQVDLTGAFGSKRLASSCSVASGDYQSQEAQDLCILDHGGIHLVFEAEGESAACDSPSALFVTDVDSKCDVLLDGQPLQKGQRAVVKPGAVIAMGQEAHYQVHRNVFAHA
jgi:hypothetical protein